MADPRSPACEGAAGTPLFSEEQRVSCGSRALPAASRGGGGSPRAGPARTGGCRACQGQQTGLGSPLGRRQLLPDSGHIVSEHVVHTLTPGDLLELANSFFPSPEVELE